MNFLGVRGESIIREDSGSRRSSVGSAFIFALMVHEVGKLSHAELRVAHFVLFQV